MSFRTQQFRRHTLSAFLAVIAWGLTACAWVDKTFSGQETAVSDAEKPASDEAPASNRKDRSFLYPLETIRGGVSGNAIVGAEDLRFRRPIAVAARDQIIYVVDAGQDLVYAYDRMTSRLKVLANLKGVVAGDVADIYVANDRSFYLTDTYGARVLHFSASGRLQRVLVDDQNLRRPVAVSVDEANGDVHVADGGLDHVLIFNSAGELFRAVGARGDGEGEFRDVTGMARNREGHYLIVSRLGFRGQALDKDGAFLYRFGDNALMFPNSVAVDQAGLVYVSDFMDNKIKIFEKGNLMTIEGGTGVAPGRFKGITDLWVDGGLLYAADSLNGRVQVFRITARAAPGVGK